MFEGPETAFVTDLVSADYRGAEEERFQEMLFHDTFVRELSSCLPVGLGTVLGLGRSLTLESVQDPRILNAPSGNGVVHTSQWSCCLVYLSCWPSSTVAVLLAGNF